MKTILKTIFYHAKRKMRSNEFIRGERLLGEILFSAPMSVLL